MFLSIALNIVTLAIVAYFIFMYKPRLDEKLKTDNKATAFEVLVANLKDPLVTSRAYFTESTSGSIATFDAYETEKEELLTSL